MARKKMTIDFKGFEELYAKLDRLGADTKNITKQALIATHNYMTPSIQSNISRRKRTGETEGSLLVSPKIKWEGMRASVGVGFDIDNGGLASIFLMYGTPRMKPDRKLYGSIYGTKIKKEVRELQEEIFSAALGEVMK